MASASTQKPVLPSPDEDIEARFKRLADIWEAAVSHHSSTSLQNSHPAYLEIVGMGQQVVPLLLRDLRLTGRPWFAALKAITCADPVAAEDRGNATKVSTAWLNWGREHGYSG
jgi:hypothetical protein